MSARILNGPVYLSAEKTGGKKEEGPPSALSSALLHVLNEITSVAHPCLSSSLGLLGGESMMVEKNGS